MSPFASFLCLVNIIISNRHCLVNHRLKALKQPDKTVSLPVNIQSTQARRRRPFHIFQLMNINRQYENLLYLWQLPSDMNTGTHNTHSYSVWSSCHTLTPAWLSYAMRERHLHAIFMFAWCTQQKKKTKKQQTKNRNQSQRSNYYVRKSKNRAMELFNDLRAKRKLK